MWTIIVINFNILSEKKVKRNSYGQYSALKLIRFRKQLHAPWSREIDFVAHPDAWTRDCHQKIGSTVCLREHLIGPVEKGMLQQALLLHTDDPIMIDGLRNEPDAQK